MIEYNRWYIKKALVYFNFKPIDQHKYDVIEYYHQNCDNGNIGKRESKESVRIDLKSTKEQIFYKINKESRYEIRKTMKSRSFLYCYFSVNLIIFIEKFLDVYSKNIIQYNSNLEISIKRMLSYYYSGKLAITSLYYKKYGFLVWHVYYVDGNNARLLYSVNDYTKIERSNLKKKLFGELNRVLHWFDILKFKRLGYVNYDFGGISNSDNTKTDGIRKFKLAFGGEVYSFVDYVEYISTKGKLFGFIANKYYSKR